MNINKLSHAEKIGQKFILGINSDNIDDILFLIKEYGIGGVILYKRNYHSYDDMLKVIKNLKEANKDNKIPLFIAIDQEWGVVNRLPRDIHNLKNIHDVSKKDKKLVYKSAIITGKVLSDSGINMDLAPVLDIFDRKENGNAYKRCFYGDIANNGKDYIEGLNKEGIIAIGKHFPGNGASKLDSHFIIPYVFDYKNVLDKHVLPFKEAINNEIDGIMMGHLVIRKLTGLLPASISKKIIDNYLRKELNYNGIIMTDEINMLRHNIFYKYICMNKVMHTSNDIVLVKIKNKKQGIRILNRAMNMKVDNALLDDSVGRILKIKDKYKINDNMNNVGINIDEINEEIDKINEIFK